ncbi:MAG: cysteine dioxygenase [Burkholderiaceae bacterium]|nr:cysteine dioxygenase [Burkholderiaceae bacterium]
MSTSTPAETAAPVDSIAPLREFIIDMTRLVERDLDEAAMLESARPLLARLISRDDWLPEAAAKPHPVYYQQHLLHCDPLERFSVVSFVWGPGQITPVHDHMVWGLVGILRGVERSQRFGTLPDGRFGALGEEALLQVGEIDAVSPRIGDIHTVANALADRPSISIHVYGANIGAVSRHVFAADGTQKPFVSGYSSEAVPNLWDRSATVRASLG